MVRSFLLYLAVHRQIIFYQGVRKRALARESGAREKLSLSVLLFCFVCLFLTFRLHTFLSLQLVYF
jgi:hypothetical protein